MFLITSQVVSVRPKKIEADDLALNWFNDHSRGLGDQPLIAREEIEAAQKEQQRLMKKIINGI